MLVLSRRQEQWISLRISREQALEHFKTHPELAIEILLIEVVGKHGVRLGFTAPDDVKILRKELESVPQQDAALA